MALGVSAQAVLMYALFGFLRMSRVQEALFNFLSTFNGTHFVTLRAYHAQAGIAF